MYTKVFFFYQRWLFCTFLEIFNLYTDLILWPIVDGCMRITCVCNVLLSGCMDFFITFEMLLPVTALLLLLYMEYLVYKKIKTIFKIRLRLSWLRNSGVERGLLVPLVWQPYKPKQKKKGIIKEKRGKTPL